MLLCTHLALFVVSNVVSRLKGSASLASGRAERGARGFSGSLARSDSRGEVGAGLADLSRGILSLGVSTFMTAAAAPASLYLQ